MTGRTNRKITVTLCTSTRYEGTATCISDSCGRGFIRYSEQGGSVTMGDTLASSQAMAGGLTFRLRSRTTTPELGMQRPFTEETAS